MNKSLRYIALLAILPLFTAGLGTDYFSDAEALKSQGVGTSKHGSQTDVCGLQLCSEIPGGKAAWMAEQNTSTTPADAPETQMTDEDHDSKMTDADLGSELRLSRANVPSEIPMHKGYYNGGDVYFIVTDSSDPTHADVITENQGWKVELPLY